jgi:amidase
LTHNPCLSPQRRHFIRGTLLTGAAAAALPALATAREFVASPAPQAQVKSFELDEATIADLQSGMTSGKYTSHSITERYLARIDEIDRHGPALASVLEVNPDALAMADAADTERKSGHTSGRMHGIPVLIKEYRHCRPHADHGRFAGPIGIEADTGCFRRAETA